MATVKSVKLNDDEQATVTRNARDLQLYEHGFIRNAIRLCGGLPVPRSFSDHVANTIREQSRHTSRVG